MATSPTAPGCNNGASTCTVGNHGYEFVYANGGTSGLPQCATTPTDVLNNPDYTTFKSNWAWANKTNNTQWAVKADASYDEAAATNRLARCRSAFASPTATSRKYSGAI